MARGSTKNAANCASLCKMQITRTSTCRTHIAGPKPWRFGSRTSEGRYRLEHESVRVRSTLSPRSVCVFRYPIRSLRVFLATRVDRQFCQSASRPRGEGSACMGVLRVASSTRRRRPASSEIFRPGQQCSGRILCCLASLGSSRSSLRRTQATCGRTKFTHGPGSPLFQTFLVTVSDARLPRTHTTPR